MTTAAPPDATLGAAYVWGFYGERGIADLRLGCGGWHVAAGFGAGFVYGAVERGGDRRRGVSFYGAGAGLSRGRRDEWTQAVTLAVTAAPALTLGVAVTGAGNDSQTQITVFGPAGRSAVVEVSADLAGWAPVVTNILTLGLLRIWRRIRSSFRGAFIGRR